MDSEEEVVVSRDDVTALLEAVDEAENYVIPEALYVAIERLACNSGVGVDDTPPFVRRRYCRAVGTPMMDAEGELNTADEEVFTPNKYLRWTQEPWVAYFWERYKYVAGDCYNDVVGRKKPVGPTMEIASYRVLNEGSVGGGGGHTVKFDVTPFDRTVWPELDGLNHLTLYESDHGYVSCTHASDSC